MKGPESALRRRAGALAAIPALFVLVLGAQEKAVLAGRVLEAGSGRPLAGVAVEIRAAGLKSRSDGEGKFEFRNLPAGKVIVAFSLPGFASLTREFVLAPGETPVREIVLERTKYDAEEVVTLESDFLTKEKITLNETVPLSGREIVRMPGTVEDLGRALAVLPSVARVSGLSNDLIVRGGSPFENGYYVDNIPLTGINFFQREGGSGGTYGILNTDLIEDVRFSAGGFPVPYGDRLSSIVDIRLKEGNSERVKSKIDLSSSALGAQVEGPVLGSLSFIASGRLSYYGLVSKIAGTGIEPDFGTLQAKATWTPSPNHKITFLDIFGACRLAMDLDAAVDYSLNHYLDSWTRQNAAGIDWRWTWGNGAGMSRTSLSTSIVKNWDLVRNVETDDEYMGRDEEERTTVLRNVNYWKAGEDLHFTFGFEAGTDDAEFNSYFASYVNRYGDIFPGFGLAGSFSARKAGVFLSAAFTLTRRLTMTAGLRGDYFSFNEHFLLSPRMSLSYAVTPRWTLNAGIGLYRQFLYALLLARNPGNTGLRDPGAVHAVLGTEIVFDAFTRLTIELYAKDYRHFPLTPDDPYLFLADNNVALSGFTFYRDVVDSGRAAAKGVEILFHKKLKEKFYGLAGASIFASRYRDLTATWRNRVSDNRLILNLVGGYTPGPRWDLSFRWSYGGGIPYTPFDPAASLEKNVGIIDETKIQAARYPAYHMLILRADRTFVFRRSRLSVYLSVVNAYNRKNVARYYWNRTKHVIEPVYQVPLLPVFGVLYEF